MSATTVELSMPSRKEGPEWTSDIICERTAEVRVSRSSLVHDRSLRPCSTVSGARQ
jgi:hypothetical protein